MCVQCMMGAMTAGAGATGARSWLATRRWSWLTAQRLRRITVALLTVALFAAATLLSGST
jgi:predicted DNA-binding helix-hairpin-helix protein